MYNDDFKKQDKIIAVESRLCFLAMKWRETHSKGLYEDASKIVQEYYDTMRKLWDLGSDGADLLPDEELPDYLMPTYYLERWNRK